MSILLATAYPQYYCEDNLQYTPCSNSDHTACMKKDSKYCTEENGLWKFRDCKSCADGKCINEYCGDNICNQNEDLYSCESDCKPSLEDYKLDPDYPAINKGDSITFKYQIYNPSSNSIKV